MNPYKNAIQNLKQTIKTLTEKKRALRKDIHALKFTDGGERRPETGPERDALWADYQWRWKPQARAALLAYGLLRGKPYRDLEPGSTRNPPSIPAVFRMLREAFPADEKALMDEWTLIHIESLLTREMAKEAA